MKFYPDPAHEPFHFSAGVGGALLIHGFPGTPAELRPLGRFLADGGVSATGLLLPGFGAQIERLGESGKRAWLAAATAEWERVAAQSRPAVLIGYSMGGALAVHLAAARPPDRLVLLAPFWRMSNWLANLLPIVKHFKPTLKPFEKADFANPGVRGQFAAIVPEADLDDPAVQAQLREEVALPTAVLDDVRSLGARAYRLASRLTSPTLIIQGKSDPTVLPQHTRRLYNRLPAPKELIEIPADHEFLRRLDLYGHLLRQFLNLPLREER